VLAAEENEARVAAGAAYRVDWLPVLMTAEFSQEARIGLSPLAPKASDQPPWGLRMNHWAVAGRNTAGSVRPVPS
jgi:hypothetical protein